MNHHFDHQHDRDDHVMNGQLSTRQGQLDAETIPLRLGTRRSALAMAQSGRSPRR